MSALGRLYDKINIQGNNETQVAPKSKTYKGFSTVSPSAESFALYDLFLIKQDLLNHFHIRLGEKLENPEFGTIIWDVLFDPLTDELKEMITKNVETIVNYDPRIRADQIIVTAYEKGIQIECVLIYFPYNIQEFIQFRFDQENGLIA